MTPKGRASALIHVGPAVDMTGPRVDAVGWAHATTLHYSLVRCKNQKIYFIRIRTAAAVQFYLYLSDFAVWSKIAILG